MARIHDRVSRRVFLTSIAAATILLWRDRSEANASNQKDVGCYWEPGGSARCDDGTRYEYWCYVCCIAGSCHVHYCEWRPAGSC